jgi:phosphoribosylformylglycinamidine synthase
MGAACRALDVPITGGNVSLYNETDGRAVLPTPVLGVVGLIEDADRIARRTFQAADDAVVLLGESRAELGGSEYLKVIHGLVRGVPPALDLAREAALQRLLVEGIAAGVIRSAHDCAEGGLAIALAECCFDSGLGVSVDVSGVQTPESSFADVATVFSESASRVVVSVSSNGLADLLARAVAANVPAVRIGTVGGTRIRITVDGRQVLDESLAESEALWSNSLEGHFERARAIA